MVELNRFRYVLAERDLNNKWLSDKFDKDSPTVSKLASNIIQPSLETFIAVANALNVPLQH